MKKRISRLALTEAALTLLWVILMILGSIFNAPVPTIDGVPIFVQQISILHIITYINASTLTVVAVLLYFAFYQHLKSDHPIMTALGLVFVPLYGIFNLFVYGSQITILPLLIAQNSPNVANWLQFWPQSPIALLNQVAYALLGISSILFGIALMRKDPAVRMAAVFLIAQRHRLHSRLDRRAHRQLPAWHGLPHRRCPLPGGCDRAGISIPAGVNFCHCERSAAISSTVRETFTLAFRPPQEDTI